MAKSGATVPGMNRRRIVIVATGLGTGGAEAMLFRVATALDPGRFSVSVISIMDEGTYGPRLAAAGIPVRAVGFSNRIPTPSRLTRLLSAVHESRADLLLGWMYHGNLAASFARRLVAPRASLVWNIRHCVYDLQSENAITRNLIRAGAKIAAGAAAVIYASTMSRDQHCELGYPTRGAVVIGNGLDRSRFTLDRSERESVRREFGFGEHEVVVGHVARYDPMKDHLTFMTAAKALAQSTGLVRFLLVGRGVSPDNPVFASWLGDPVLGPKVALAGERHDVARLLQGMDVFCLSSYSESFPNAVLEAAAVGLPCVVTRVGCAADIAGDGAIVVEPRNPALLADALGRLVAAPQVERESMGAQAYRHSSAHHMLDGVVREYEAVLGRALAPAGSR